MAVKCEVITIDTLKVTVAFYYAVGVGDRLAAANDQSRTAAGSALPAGELQDLKDGYIHEKVITYDLPYSMTNAQCAAWLEAKWMEWTASAALEEYTAMWTFSGMAGDYWDATGWH